MILLVDPETREPLDRVRPPNDIDERYTRTHWRPGWRSGMNYENGIPTAMWFAQCQDPCCDAFRCEPLPEPGDAW